MRMRSPREVRQGFIEFFRERGHTFVPSSPVVPHGDPTLLFTNAGMNQFKDVFLDQGSRPYTRAVNSQKCIRVSGKHNDLEEVGFSPDHHTFFEMLGNWSFGDYYKREAIIWAWELITGVWKMPPQRLYATVFRGDDEVPFDEEAYKVWREEVGLPDDRILAFGRKDNFWEMGEIGPCGPCSEIHYDLGPEFCRRGREPGHQCEVNGGCGRIVEIWNLVFIQFNRDPSGSLKPLPRRHIDTGAGLERILRIMWGTRTNFETPLFLPLIEEVEDMSGVKYYSDHRGVAHRVAVDHVRMLAFALTDGVIPSNEGRGYVVRRILRRAARFGRELGLENPFLYKLLDPLVEVMGQDFPELKERYRSTSAMIKAEEESFARTLGRGLELFSALVKDLEGKGEKVIPGEEAFKLYDTYGFPLDLTELMAREQGLIVDSEGFKRLMEEQKERARGEFQMEERWSDWDNRWRTEFLGYEQWEVQSQVLGIRKAEGGVDIVLSQSPFYVEAGGQISDRGWIRFGDREWEVMEVFRIGEAVVHRIKMEDDEQPLPQPGDTVTARIDPGMRIPTQYNHTATHLLHAALRMHLGNHAQQAGSLVAPDRLRFDFTHFEKLTPEQVEAIERTVNSAIRADMEVRWFYLPYQEAIKKGVTALFGEKYGEVVRVVQVGPDDQPFSRELCGGCHVKRTGQIGLFRIISEEAAAAGVRRIEAITGETAILYTQQEHRQLEALRDILGSRGSDVVEKGMKLVEEKKQLEKEQERLLAGWAKGVAREMLGEATHIAIPFNAFLSTSRSDERGDGDIVLVTRYFEPMPIDRIKMVGDRLRELELRVVALMAGPTPTGAGQLCCVVGDDLVKRGILHAGDLIAKAARIAGGGGGGKAHLATAGAKTPNQLHEALQAFPTIVREAINLKTEPVK